MTYSLRRTLMLLVLAVVVTGAATVALLNADVPRIFALAPTALLVGLVGALLSLTRFELFVLALLASRAAIDSIQITSGLSLNAVLALAFLPVGLVWIAADVRTGRRRTPTTLPSVLLVFAALLSVTAAARPSTSLVEVLRLASALIMLEVLQRFVTSRAQLVRLLSALAVSLVVPVGLGLMQFSQGKGVDIGGFVRINGTLRHPNPYSFYLVVILLMLIAVYPHVRPTPRLVLAAFIVPTAAALIFTYTRSAYIGFIVGAVVIAVLQSKKLLVGLVALGVALVLVNPTVLARFGDLGTSESSTGATGNSLIWRVQYWGETVRLARERPVTGIGLGMVRTSTVEQKQPHNDFIRTAAETGVIGLLAYIWLLVGLVQVARRGLRRARSELPRGVAVGFAAVVTSVIVVSFVSNVLSQVVLLWYVGAAAGAAVGAARVWPVGEDELDESLDETDPRLPPAYAADSSTTRA